jgi:hypothetical protein
MTLVKSIAPYLLAALLSLTPLSAFAQTASTPKRDWANFYLARVDTDNKGYATLADAERYGIGQFDRLDANRDSEMNVAEAALATEVLLAAYRSATTREVVNLPLPRK